MFGNFSTMFTVKPHVTELGYMFLFRNYDSSLGKWSTADPLGYPDGWNNFAYCNNGVTDAIDWLGTKVVYTFSGWTLLRMVGLNGELIQSGIQMGDSVMLIWQSSWSYKCDQCNSSNTLIFYETTIYTVDTSNPKTPYAWTAPSVQTITITADNIIAALGIPTDALSVVQHLVDKTIANNLVAENVDQLALNKKPRIPVKLTHKCE